MLESLEFARMNPNMTSHTIRNDLYFPELSYQIIGAAFEVHRELGPRYQEKYYQRALALGLTRRNIAFNEQVLVPLRTSNGIVGNYRVDFLVDDKIVLELKTVIRMRAADYTQLVAYLRALEKPLGILINFRTPMLTSKRIVNADFDKRSKSIKPVRDN